MYFVYLSVWWIPIFWDNTATDMHTRALVDNVKSCLSSFLIPIYLCYFFLFLLIAMICLLFDLVRSVFWSYFCPFRTIHCHNHSNVIKNCYESFMFKFCEFGIEQLLSVLHCFICILNGISFLNASKHLFVFTIKKRRMIGFVSSLVFFLQFS